MTSGLDERVPRVAKTQKTFYLNEDLATLVDRVTETSGASFTKIVTAALLAYLFHSFQDPQQGQAHGPTPYWMRLAVLLERRELSIGDIPLELLNDWIDARERYIADCAQDDAHKDQVDALAKELKDVKAIRRGWKNNIEDFGGTIDALADAMGRYWVKKMP